MVHEGSSEENPGRKKNRLCQLHGTHFNSVAFELKFQGFLNMVVKYVLCQIGLHILLKSEGMLYYYSVCYCDTPKWNGTCIRKATGADNVVMTSQPGQGHLSAYHDKLVT